jgi:hypothetical protein
MEFGERLGPRGGGPSILRWRDDLSVVRETGIHHGSVHALKIRRVAGKNPSH